MGWFADHFGSVFNGAKGIATAHDKQKAYEDTIRDLREMGEYKEAAIRAMEDYNDRNHRTFPRWPTSPERLHDTARSAAEDFQRAGLQPGVDLCRDKASDQLDKLENRYLTWMRGVGSSAPGGLASDALWRREGRRGLAETQRKREALDKDFPEKSR